MKRAMQMMMVVLLAVGTTTAAQAEPIVAKEGLLVGEWNGTPKIVDEKKFKATLRAGTPGATDAEFEAKFKEAKQGLEITAVVMKFEPGGKATVTFHFFNLDNSSQGKWSVLEAAGSELKVKMSFDSDDGKVEENTQSLRFSTKDSFAFAPTPEEMKAGVSMVYNRKK